MFKLVLSDMDNTLIPIGRSHVSARTLVAIQALRAAGIEFGPCTGRGPVELEPFFLHDAGYFQTGVLYNGQTVYVDGELVSESLCAPADLRRLQEAALEHPGTCLFYYPLATDEANPAYCVGASAEEAAAYGRRYRFTPHVVDAAPEVPYVSVTVATTGGEGVVGAVRDAVREQGLALELVETFSGWCDVLPRGVNKASGIRVLARELGVSRDEVVFFGDAENDLAAIAEVENSVAVANAMPAAARAARWHVGACADDGVAVAMVDIALAAQRGERPAFMRGAGREGGPATVRGTGREGGPATDTRRGGRNR